MNKNNLSIASLFFANGLIYGLNSLYSSFIQIYVSKYHGPEIAGILLAIGPIVLIVAPIFWGVFADKAKSKNFVLALSVAGGAISYFMLMLNQSFIYLAIFLALCMFFKSSFGSLVDIITLEYSSSSKSSYGKFRIVGTIIYGILPLPLTFFTEKYFNIVFYTYVVLAIPTIISVMMSPRVAGHGAGRKKLNLIPIFRDYKLMFLFFFSAVSQFAWAYYLNFFPGHLTDNLGQSQQIWGINTFLTVLCEIPFFLAFNKLFEKFGIKVVLFASLVLGAVRYMALALITNVPVLLVIGLFTGLSVTVFTYCASYYITKFIPPHIKASANSMLYALGNGIPRALAGIIGGYMTANLGYTVSMLICGILSIITLVLFFFTFAKFKLTTPAEVLQQN